MRKLHRHRERLCQTFGGVSNVAPVAWPCGRLTGSRKSDINVQIVPSARRLCQREGSPVPRVRGHRRAEGRGGRRPAARTRRGHGPDPGERAQPSRRRRPRRCLAVPGRASAHARHRGRRRRRGARRRRRGLGGGRPRQPVHHGHLRRLPVLRHRSREPLPDTRLHQLLDGRRLRRARRRQGPQPDPDPRLGVLRGRRGAPGRVRDLLAHAVHARQPARRRDGHDQLGRQRHRFGRRAAGADRRRLRDRQRFERREARPRAGSRHGRGDQPRDRGRRRARDGADGRPRRRPRLRALSAASCSRRGSTR